MNVKYLYSPDVKSKAKENRGCYEVKLLKSMLHDCTHELVLYFGMPYEMLEQHEALPEGPFTPFE